jgi:peptidyl-prolyl cis-trans isomerase D
VSAPIRTDRGYALISVAATLPAHQGTLAEVKEKVLTDFRRDKATELAKTDADELAKKAKAGTDLAAAAKSMGFEAKTSDLVSRSTSITDVGSASQIGAAFSVPAGQGGDPIFLGSNWVVFKVLEHQAANPDDLPKQRQDITQQLLQNRREMAYEAFRTSLENRLKGEGKLVYNDQNLRRLTSSNL